MTLPKFTSYMLSNQPDQTAYLLNKLAQGTGGEGGKLYNETGQNTDGAMTQKATTNALGTKADAVTVGQQLANKVDKEAGKGLSTNDFTDADESKLDGIESGAEVNVQSDWDQSDNTADDYIKNKPDNLVYSDNPGTATPATPYVDTSDIIDGAVSTSKIAAGAVTTTRLANAAVAENKIDWSTFSPCVSRFMFTGSDMTSDAGDLVRTTLRGTQLTFTMTQNSIYISSGADHIQKAHYSISYNHPVVNSNYGITGVKANSRSYGYFTGYNLSGPINTFNNGIYTDTDLTYGDLFGSTGDKDSFHTEFDIIRSLSNTNASKNNLWFMFGHIQSSYNTFAVDMRCECTAVDNGTIPAVYQRSAYPTYYSIIIEVYEE